MRTAFLTVEKASNDRKREILSSSYNSFSHLAGRYRLISTTPAPRLHACRRLHLTRTATQPYP